MKKIKKIKIKLNGKIKLIAENTKMETLIIALTGHQYVHMKAWMTYYKNVT
mgnify:CR=1 FL=1